MGTENNWPVRIIVLANQKGGVGKSTSAVSLASGLAYNRKRTLLIDMDPQANATFATLGPTQPEPTMLEFLLSEDHPLANVIHRSPQECLDVIPSNIDLAAAETELFTPMDGRVRLKSKLNKQLNGQYDYVVIDVPPSLGLLTINALAAATEVIIPVAPSMFGLQGIAKLEDTIAKVREHLNCPDLHISGVLCTFYDHTNVAQDVVNLIREHFGDKMFQSIIPKNVKIEEANSRSTNIYAYATNSKGSITYAEFVKEVMDRG